MVGRLHICQVNTIKLGIYKHCLVLHQFKAVSSVVQVYVVNLSISVFELTSKPNKSQKKKKRNNGYYQLIN